MWDCHVFAHEQTRERGRVCLCLCECVGARGKLRDMPPPVLRAAGPLAEAVLLLAE